MSKNKALLAAIVALFLVAVGLTAAPASGAPVGPSPAPRVQAGVYECVTSTAGTCTVHHSLGVTPAAITVSPYIPDTQAGFMFAVGVSTPTASAFVVKARLSTGAASAGWRIRVSYVVWADSSAPPTSATTTK